MKAGKLVTAWIVRSGVAGERDRWALDNGLAGGGFREFPELTAARTRNEVRAVVEASLPDRNGMQVATAAGQLWALRDSIKPGDLVVLPLKTTRHVAFGLCTGGYRWIPDGAEDRHHAISVDWRRDDVPRSAFKDDLLNTINGALTVFSASRNNAEARLRTMLQTGVDPGLQGAGAGAEGSVTGPTGEAGDSDATAPPPVDPVPAVTVEAIRDTVRTHLTENFSGHKLTQLVADILTALGYTCEVSPAGPDFGVDILAGQGPLGLDSPTVVVEVKSEPGQIGVPVLNQLQGAVTSHQADQALLVAWGGLNKPAEQLRMTQRLKIRVWTAEDMLDRLFETYERLPAETRALLPLKRAWVLDTQTG